PGLPLAVSAAAPPPQPPGALPKAVAKGFWIQFGAFAKLDGAEAFREKLLQEADWMSPLLAIFKDQGLHRLQAGPYASRDDARQAAGRVRGTLALNTVVVEKK
ncbi:MAG: SPOR domain-containing protein, partial [Burkholderiaceae bacterium]